MTIDYEKLLESPPSNAPKGEELGPLLREAAKKHPLLALTEAKKYIKLLPEDEGVSLLKQAAKSTRDAALYVVDDYIEFIPEAERAGLLKEIATDLLEASQGSPKASSQPTLKKHLDSDTLRNLTENYERFSVIATLNFHHELKPEQRFASIDNFDAQQLYELIAFGQQESMYTSTYLEVLDRFDKQLNKENKNVYDLKQSEHHDSAHAFLKKAIFHNRPDKALPHIPRDKWEEILENTGKYIESGNTSSVVFLADILKQMPDESIKKQIEQFVQEKYASSSGRTKDIYGIIASYHNGDTKPPPITLESPGIYAIPKLEEISSRELLGSDGIHRQLVVFSNDRDGQYSYDTFLKQYISSKDYTVVDKGEFIKIVPASREDTRMEIYMNKPSASPEKIMKALTADKNSDLEFEMVVHRGHSYNLDNTLPFFSSHNAIQFIGSCGSNKNIEKLLEIAPKAHIISTKGIGTTEVNNPLIFDINESIRTQGKVSWPETQNFLDALSTNAQRFKENFATIKEDYVLPHNNTSLHILKKMSELDQLREMTSTVSIDPKAPETVPSPSPQRSITGGVQR